jgi:hypothetical protein
VNWFHKIRLRALAVLAAGIFAAFALVSWAAWPIIPVVGATFLTVAAVVHSMTSRLAEPICFACGSDLHDQPTGVYGAVCPTCGAINEHLGDRRA